MPDELEDALAEALAPMLKKMVAEEVERAKFRWRWQSVKQAAITLDMSEAAIRQRARRRQIPARKLDGRLYVDMEALDRQLARLQ
jgi:hypothetical protein